MDIRVLDVLNSDHELQALPVEENLTVLLSGMPDLFDIEKRIFLVRVESDQPEPNVSDALVRSVGDTHVDQYDTIDYDYSLKDNGESVELSINPIEPLLPNSNYYLVVSKELTPEFYSINKTNSLGSSTLLLETSVDAVGEDATYRIVVSQTSNLSGGMHTIGIDLFKDGSQLLTNHLINVKAEKLSIGPVDDSILVSFSTGIPFLAGEEWTVVLTDFTRLGDTKVQEISTYLDSSLIESPEETSTRLSEADAMKFYEDFGWAGRTVEAETSPVDQSASVEYTFVYPNKLFMKLPKDIDPATVDANTFSVDISYAFGNYLLPNMGLYKESDKFVLKYSLFSTDTLLIEISKDTSNVVPSNDKFILESK